MAFPSEHISIRRSEKERVRISQLKKVRTKICLVGDGGVGKTSLIRKYVHNLFDDKYLKTIGTKVSRKEMMIPYPECGLSVSLDAVIWDIMGQKPFLSLLQEAYFHGASGIIAVCDTTKKETLSGLMDWFETIERIIGDVPRIILANKSDLKEKTDLDPESLREMADTLNAAFLLTSAKTGKNVNEAFTTMGYKIMEKQLNM